MKRHHPASAARGMGKRRGARLIPAIAAGRAGGGVATTMARKEAASSKKVLPMQKMMQRICCIALAVMNINWAA